MTAKSKKIGRPAKYTNDLAMEICRRIAEGEPLTKICKDPAMPSYSTVMNWRKDNPDFLETYACAREDAGDTLADDIISIADQVLAGEIDPHAARVAIDAKKWAASKLKPRSYGDRLNLDHSGEVATNSILAANVPEWMAARIAEDGGIRSQCFIKSEVSAFNRLARE